MKKIIPPSKMRIRPVTEKNNINKNPRIAVPSGMPTVIGEVIPSMSRPNAIAQRAIPE
jgi:hypothetical protein